MHPEGSLDVSTLQYHRRKNTDEIVASLEPDAGEPLLVKFDGTVMDGNTRIHVLRERGYDVDTLPRMPYESGPLPGSPDL